MKFCTRPPSQNEFSVCVSFSNKRVLCQLLPACSLSQYSVRLLSELRSAEGEVWAPAAVTTVPSGFSGSLCWALAGVAWAPAAVAFLHLHVILGMRYKVLRSFGRGPGSGRGAMTPKSVSHWQQPLVPVVLRSSLLVLSRHSDAGLLGRGPGSARGGQALMRDLWPGPGGFSSD